MGQQHKRKEFRLEWLDVPEFKDWLSPDLDSPYKARCLACSTILNAGKSELDRHAVGARHEKAVEVLKQMILEQQELDEAHDIDEEDSDDIYDSRESMVTQTLVTSEEVIMNQSEKQRQQQFEVINRIASSMENLATAAIGVLETLGRNQETLNNILLHLINK